MHLEKAIFANRAPFDRTSIRFERNGISVLSAINGKGKTSILSHIVDSFYEMARPHFHNEFEGRENKFYRVSSPIHTLDQDQPSIVYLRFQTQDGKFDYIDIRGSCNQEQYDLDITLSDKIPFSSIQSSMQSKKFCKLVYPRMNTEQAQNLFAKNLLTYFPAYRFEQPGYLNDPYKVKLDFRKLSGFSGMLRNPIEVVSSLHEIANWILDLTLDLQYGKQSVRIRHGLLNQIITYTLSGKNFGPLRFGIGERNFGSTRIQIVHALTGQPVYPSIFNLSSGEAAILCIFGEILRQFDNNEPDSNINEITGIVLIDEIDKHLHIKLQKEILPKLLNLFPNLQFIISSHSPFLGIGLAEQSMDRSSAIDLDHYGLSVGLVSNDLYKEVYDLMVNENQKFKTLYDALSKEMRTGNLPLVITEGKTDLQHLGRAKRELGITDLEYDCFTIPETGWGSATLKNLLENISKLPNKRQIIGVFDRDEPAILKDIEGGGNQFKSYGNNVYAFCIPVPTGRDNFKNISIEFYYSDSELKTMFEGKCVFFDNELNFDSKRKPISRIDAPQENYEKKIWAENIGDLPWIHSKARFGELVEKEDHFVKGWKFDNFQKIFTVIRLIIAKPLNSEKEVVKD